MTHTKQKFKSRESKLERAFIKIYREESLVKNDNKCEYCRDLLNYKSVTADHVDPKSKGGLNRKANIVASCKPCNYAKGSMSKKQFINKISSFPSGENLHLIRAWMRRRINLQTERSIKSISKVFGIKS